jgi:dihydroorotate dehydrogenase (fumarate)
MLLATNYLGMVLKNPLVASASPLNSNLDNLRRLEDAGAAAIVLPSLFQEQIEGEEETLASRVEAYAECSPEALSYFPATVSGPYGVGPERYLDLVRRGKQAVSIPIIASLNGSSRGGWIDHARLVEQAGAAALELNMYHLPTDLLESGCDVEARYTEIAHEVCGSVALPVSIKLTPYLSSIGHFAVTLVEHGAAGLVLFNRLLEPNIDLLRMTLTDTIELSGPAEMRQPLLWTAILAGRVRASLAASTGVATVTEVVKCLLAGADVVMTTSALLRHDIEYMSTLIDGLRTWGEEREISSLDDIRGMMSWQRSRDRSVYTRANYLRILERYVDHLAPAFRSRAAKTEALRASQAAP